MIEIDNTQYNKMFDNLRKKSKKIYNEAIRGYTTKLAFKTKKSAEFKIQSRFNFKSTSTLNRSKKKIAYTKSKIVAGKWQSEVGSTGDIKASTTAKQGAYWLGKQELGEKVQQKKFKKTSFRSQLMTRVLSKTMKAKQVRQVSKNIIEAPFTNKMGLAIGIKKAKRKGKMYLGTKWGVYYVPKGKYRKGKSNAVKIYNFSKKNIQLKKRKWLKPATDTIMKNYLKYANSEIDRAFKKFI